MSKNCNETVHLQSEKREECIRKMRGERLQGIAEGTSSAPPLARSSATSFPGKNECLRTHCSFIEPERGKRVSAREIEVEGKIDERTERESDRRRIEEKWLACWCCRDQQRACRMAQALAEKLDHTGPAERERVASVPQGGQLASTPEPPLPKRKETELSIQITRSCGGREPR